MRSLDGDIVECGVGWGRSLLYLLCLAQIDPSVRKVWAFDSFEGFPEPSPEDRSERNPQKGEWKSDVDSILGMIKEAGVSDAFVQSQLTVKKGFFDTSLKYYTGSRIALLHIDVDLYQSYLDVLNQLFSKVISGGVIVFDEYMSESDLKKFPGAKKAIDEFFKGRGEIQKDSLYGKYYFIKK